MVPLWLFIVVVVGLVLSLAVLIYLHFVQNPLPFPDWGNAVFVCPASEQRKVLLQILKRHGVTPDMRVRSALADRAIFFRRFRFIVNITQDESWGAMGKPAAGLAIVVKYPARAAAEAHDAFEKAGFTAQIFYDPDEDVPAGNMAIVRSEALPQWVLVFRTHFTQMGPKPPKWRDGA